MKKQAMNEGSEDALRQILRLAAVGALGGGALRTGLEALRQSNPRYDPPQIQKPIIVAIPRPVPAGEPVPSTQLPAMNRMMQLPADHGQTHKVAEGSPPEWLSKLPFGDKIWEWLPTSRPLTGPPDATSHEQIPLAAAGMGIGAIAGTGAGYMLADKLLRSADRRRARRDLEEAQREYQDTAINRARAIQFPTKVAAEIRAVIDGGDTIDPVVQRIKKALDRAYAAGQIVGSSAVAPPAMSPGMTAPVPPLPSTIRPGGGSSGVKQPAPPLSTSVAPEPPVNGSGATETNKLAEDGEDSAAKLLRGWLFPGTLMGNQAASANMLLAGGGAALGGYLGYQHSRDQEGAERTRRAIRDVDKANATAIPAPMIAQLVPVPSSPR